MEQGLTVIISVVVLLLVAGIFAYFYMRTLSNSVRNSWLDVMDRLNTRVDKIPNLIETLNRFTEGQNEFFSGLIELRGRVWPLDKPNKERVHAEFEVKSNLDKCWELAGKYDALNHDTNFLSLQMEFREIGKEIDDLTNKYNDKVRSYNRSRKLLVFRPILSLMGFRKKAVLEFE